MGSHLATCRTPLDNISPTAIKYTLAKKIAIAEDFAAGFGYTKVCARHGVSRSTVHAIVHNQQIQEMINPEIVERRRKSMAGIYEYYADRAIESIDDEKLSKAQAPALMTMAAIATDKARLLRGESTQNIGVRTGVESINSDLLELKQKREMLFGDIGQSVASSASQVKSDVNNSQTGVITTESIDTQRKGSK